MQHEALMMSVPLSMDRFSDLVGLIYDAAIDTGRWPIAIDQIRIALGFRIASLNLQALPYLRKLKPAVRSN